MIGNLRKKKKKKEKEGRGTYAIFLRDTKESVPFGDLEAATGNFFFSWGCGGGLAKMAKKFFLGGQIVHSYIYI